MRDIILTLLVFGLLPFVFSRPYVGIYIWVWLGFMNPHRMTWGFAYEFPFSDFVAAAVLSTIMFSKQTARIPWTRETVLLLGFILWMWLTTFFAYYQTQAWGQWNKVWKIQLMVYVTMLVIKDRQKLDWLIWVIVLSLGIFGIKGGIFTIVHGGVYNVMGPPGSFIGGNNEIALALTMTIPLMRYLQLQATNKWIAHGLTAAMIITGIAVIGSQSRGALLGLVAMGIFLWLKSRKKMFMLVAIMVVAGGVITIMPQEWYERMETIQTYETDASALGRINAWHTAYNIAKSRITGGGFDTFHPGVFGLYAPDPYDVHDAHSIFFEVLGEQGFFGLFLFLLLAWFTWNTGSRIRRRARHDQENIWAADLASMIQVSLVGYAGCGLFLGLAYFDYYYTLIAIMVICKCILDAQVAANDYKPEPQDARKKGAESAEVKEFQPLAGKQTG